MKLVDEAINLLNEATAGNSYSVNHKRLENLAANLFKLGFKLKDLSYAKGLDTIVIRKYEQPTARAELDKSVIRLLKKYKFTEKSGEYFLYGSSDKLPAVKVEVLDKGTK